jgi:m7GpppX diphosphatase
MKSIKTLSSNDRHTSEEVEGIIKMKGILYKILNPEIYETKTEYVFIHESYQDYIDKINKLNPSNYQWIYNIIDNNAEKDKVIYEDSNFVLIPDYTWDKVNLDQIHILAIIRDKSIRSIRDIKQSDLPLLDKIKTISLNEIEKKYMIKENKLKLFFHYPPSTYQLHIHITHISKTDIKTNFDRSHDFFQVVKNIELDAGYYKDTMRITSTAE